MQLPSPNLQQSAKLRKRQPAKPVPAAAAAASLQRVHSTDSRKPTKIRKLFRRLSSTSPLPSPNPSLHKGIYTPPTNYPASPALSSIRSPRPLPTPPSDTDSSTPQTTPTMKQYRNYHLRQPSEDLWEQMRSRGLVLKGSLEDDAVETSPFMLSPSKFATPAQFASRPKVLLEIDPLDTSFQPSSPSPEKRFGRRFSVASHATFPQSCYSESISDFETASTSRTMSEPEDGSVIQFLSSSASSHIGIPYHPASPHNADIMLPNMQQDDAWPSMQRLMTPDRNSRQSSIDSQIALARQRLRDGSLASSHSAAWPSLSILDEEYSCQDVPDDAAQIRRSIVAAGWAQQGLDIDEMEQRTPRPVQSVQRPSWTSAGQRTSSYVPALDLIFASYLDGTPEDEDADEVLPSLSRSIESLPCNAPITPSALNFSHIPRTRLCQGGKRPTQIPQPVAVRHSAAMQPRENDAADSLVTSIDLAISALNVEHQSRWSSQTESTTASISVSDCPSFSMGRDSTGRSTSPSSVASSSRLPRRATDPIVPKVEVDAATTLPPQKPSHSKSMSLASIFGFKKRP